MSLLARAQKGKADWQKQLDLSGCCSLQVASTQPQCVLQCDRSPLLRIRRVDQAPENGAEPNTNCLSREEIATNEHLS